MDISFSLAEAADAQALAALHNSVAQDLTRRFGQGPWLPNATERGVLAGMRHAKMLLARQGKAIAGTLRLHTKKPWAIDIAYFTPVKKAIYLTGMAVAPPWQQMGIGKMLMAEAELRVREWPADSIRLDAYDRNSGAGGFYAKIGFAERGHVVYRKSPLVYYERVF